MKELKTVCEKRHGAFFLRVMNLARTPDNLYQRDFFFHFHHCPERKMEEKVTEGNKGERWRHMRPKTVKAAEFHHY